jgi:hypothetical protein
MYLNDYVYIDILHICNFLPIMADILSEYDPAQLTMYLARKVSTSTSYKYGQLREGGEDMGLRIDM